jgi:hypothetical protein
MSRGTFLFVGVNEMDFRKFLCIVLGITCTAGVTISIVEHNAKKELKIVELNERIATIKASKASDCQVGKLIDELDKPEHANR